VYLLADWLWAAAVTKQRTPLIRRATNRRIVFASPLVLVVPPGIGRPNVRDQGRRTAVVHRPLHPAVRRFTSVPPPKLGRSLQDGNLPFESFHSEELPVLGHASEDVGATFSEAEFRTRY
jgi:hypothetical protein